MNRSVLHETQSLCPVCLNKIPARYTAREDGVWLEKRCDQHGDFAAPIWDSASEFTAWIREYPIQPPKHPTYPVERGCPFDCGLCVNHRQAPCCVLMEVTERCNLGCPVCFARSGAAGADVPLETISGWYDLLLDQGGPFNIQLSGGEPTLREDLPQIISTGVEKGFSFFQLNTNGLRIAQDLDYLRRLAGAGLNTVFLQFDGLSAQSGARLRGRDLVAEKRAAIAHCRQAGVGVVLVPTVCRGVNEGELGHILEFAASEMPTVRGVHFQPISFFGRVEGLTAGAGRMTIPALLSAIEGQTGGKLKRSDFLPGGGVHALCSFHANYTVRDGTWTLQQTASSCCCHNTSDAARKKVASQWSAPQESRCCKDSGLDSLDAFLHQRKYETLAVSGMAFQDGWTVDLERLCRCNVHVVRTGQLIPFCSCQLTAEDGAALHL
ncbi:MAG: radical SAM protein [Oscillospiraceae bacterium]|nr:radical SAM protein [Oscillospiraceae bacterium]